MTAQLTHQFSPFSQAMEQKRTGINRVDGLNARDQQLLRELLDEPYECMENDVFLEDEAERKLFDDAPEVPVPNTDWYHPLMNSLGNDESALKNNKPLVWIKKQEQAIFLQYNYCRHRAKLVHEQIDPNNIDPKLGHDLLYWHGRAQQLRDSIAATNLALVLAMARRFRGSELDYADLISEGNMALLRSIDKFRVSKGFKFSTYACRAILKAFSRIGVKVSRYRQLFPNSFDASMERSDYVEQKRKDEKADAVDELRRIIDENRANLTDVEKKVIKSRFRIDEPVKMPAKAKTRRMTLEQVGKLIGVTKERVRQIQAKAYQKLRRQIVADWYAQ